MNYCLEFMWIYLIVHIILVQLCVRDHIIYLIVLTVVALWACWCRGKTGELFHHQVCNVWRHWWHSRSQISHKTSDILLACTRVGMHLDGSRRSEPLPERTCHFELWTPRASATDPAQGLNLRAGSGRAPCVRRSREHEERTAAGREKNAEGPKNTSIWKYIYIPGMLFLWKHLICCWLNWRPLVGRDTCSHLARALLGLQFKSWLQVYHHLLLFMAVRNIPNIIMWHSTIYAACGILCWHNWRRWAWTSSYVVNRTEQLYDSTARIAGPPFIQPRKWRRRRIHIRTAFVTVFWEKGQQIWLLYNCISDGTDNRNCYEEIYVLFSQLNF